MRCRAGRMQRHLLLFGSSARRQRLRLLVHAGVGASPPVASMAAVAVAVGWSRGQLRVAARAVPNRLLLARLLLQALSRAHLQRLHLHLRPNPKPVPARRQNPININIPAPVWISRAGDTRAARGGWRGEGERARPRHRKQLPTADQQSGVFLILATKFTVGDPVGDRWTTTAIARVDELHQTKGGAGVRYGRGDCSAPKLQSQARNVINQPTNLGSLVRCGSDAPAQRLRAQPCAPPPPSPRRWGQPSTLPP